jgi:hypothetical protein
MSGIEVAGLVLGAIPIVVAALKGYKEAKQRYIWFMSKEAHIDRLIQSLNEQVYFIKSDVEVALRSTDLEQDRIRSVLTDPDLSLWHDDEVIDAISDYLGEGLPLYLNTLERCQQTICTIVNNLNGLVSDTTKVSVLGLASIYLSHLLTRNLSDQRYGPCCDYQRYLQEERPIRIPQEDQIRFTERGYRCPNSGAGSDHVNPQPIQ